VKERIQEMVHPATLAQVSYFHRLGLRERTLGFVVMVAFVLEMIWRQIGSVNALTRIVQKEAVLWEQPRKVSQQALSQRLASLPSDLFLRVLRDVLPQMQVRWMERERLLSPVLHRQGCACAPRRKDFSPGRVVDFGSLVPVRVGGDAAAAQMVTEDVFHAHVLGGCVFTGLPPLTKS